MICRLWLSYTIWKIIIVNFDQKNFVFDMEDKSSKQNSASWETANTDSMSDKLKISRKFPHVKKLPLSTNLIEKWNMHELHIKSYQCVRLNFS